MNTRTKIFLLFAALLVLSLNLVAFSPVEQGVQRFREAIIQTLTVTGDGTVADDLTVTGDVVAGDGLSVTTGGATVTAGGLTVTAGGATVTAGGVAVTDGGLTLSDDNLTVADFNIWTNQSTLTVTDGGTITPTGSYQPLTAAGAVGATIATTGYTTGTVVLFQNMANQTITITDTGVIRLSGNAALGQYDTLLVLWDGSSWIQVAPEGDN